MCYFRQTDLLRKETFLPVLLVSPDHGLYVIFINGAFGCTNRVWILSRLKSIGNPALNIGTHLLIGDKGRQENGMCPSALGAEDPADFKDVLTP